MPPNFRPEGGEFPWELKLNQLRVCIFRCWTVLACVGPCWPVLACAGPCWPVLARVGLCWRVLSGRSLLDLSLLTELEEQLHEQTQTLWVTPNETGGAPEISSRGLTTPQVEEERKITGDLPLRVGNPTPRTEVE